MIKQYWEKLKVYVIKVKYFFLIFKCLIWAAINLLVIFDDDLTFNMVEKKI